MSNEPKFKIALSREALKYYQKVPTVTARRLDKSFANLESEPAHGRNIKRWKGWRESTDTGSVASEWFMRLISQTIGHPDESGQ
ncbi:MAG: hypothetical protein HY673_14735 [Chloroflexi bacterium]|nr:hypothetical protein [Chloroflexota bacterium]